MNDEVAEKGKRKRRRSARVYANLSQLTPEQLEERLRVLAAYFPGDDEDQAVKGTPLHSMSSGYSDQLALAQGANVTHKPTPACARYHDKDHQPVDECEYHDPGLATEGSEIPDAIKAILGEGSAHPANPAGPGSAADMAQSATFAHGRDAYSVYQFNGARVSESLTSGHSRSASTGDHGVGTGRNNHVAVEHANLNQHGTTPLPFMQRTESPHGFVGSAAFHSPFSMTDAPPGAPGDTFTVSQVDSRAGSYRGMNPVSRNPGDGSRPYGMARTSGTPDNGGHSLSAPESNAVANKLSPLDIIKQAQRDQGLR